MAVPASTTATINNASTNSNQPTKLKRRKCREIVVSSSSANSSSGFSVSSHPNVDRSVVIVSSEDSWCFPASKPSVTPPVLPPPPPPPPSQSHRGVTSPTPTNGNRASDSVISSSAFRVPVMDFSGAAFNGHSGSTHDSFPSGFSKFNSALTAGLLNPMSPPPSTDKTRSSPTLFEMMANEPDIHSRTSQIPSHSSSVLVHKNQIPVEDKQGLMMQRISEILGSRSPGNQFNDASSSDIQLTLSSKDGISVWINVHRQILVAHSRFFASKLSERWAKQQQSTSPYIVEIADCDDIEVYIQTLKLMYCRDLRKRLMKEDVPKILGILKVSAAIGFDVGVLSCLEYLEAAPWAEEEEEKVASLLSELHLEGVAAGEVLKRVSTEATGLEDGNGNGNGNDNDNEELLLKLLHVVLEGKDEKARREMKGLVSKMLRESSSPNDLRKESLYAACDGCLQLLCHHFMRAVGSDFAGVGEIAKQADNLHWILDILIDRQIAEDFLRTWASQCELSAAHSKVPAVHRFEISRVTARLLVGIGKGQLLAPKDVRYQLLQTWLVPFYDDFGWMRRASRGFDRHLIEDGLSNTILTLPLAWQQDILLAWFNRFINSGEDCPNIQRGFEVWWRRAFSRRKGEQERPRPIRIATPSAQNS
ncbi:BTB/POZ domain-containing protein, partial [Cucurbita argyrosperma subsp. argyrosperma]|uniref:BTB/POZ domain-containing protein At1g63850-like n=1 Tax=Cucurbita moschata TaxID=3662 RepID=A0A6J1ELW5_CUCMO